MQVQRSMITSERNRVPLRGSTCACRLTTPERSLTLFSVSLNGPGASHFSQSRGSRHVGTSICMCLMLPGRRCYLLPQASTDGYMRPPQLLPRYGEAQECLCGRANCSARAAPSLLWLSEHCSVPDTVLRTLIMVLYCFAGSRHAANFCCMDCCFV